MTITLKCTGWAENPAAPGSAPTYNYTLTVVAPAGQAPPISGAFNLYNSAALAVKPGETIDVEIGEQAPAEPAPAAPAPVPAKPAGQSWGTRPKS